MERFEFQGGPLDGDRRRTAGQPWFQVRTLWGEDEVEVWYERDGSTYVHRPDGPPVEITA